MSTIIYTLEKCVKCLKCIKVCPTGAISMHESKIIVDNEKCVNCGTCMDACNHLGLQTEGSNLSDMAYYDYNIALVPTAVYGDCTSVAEVNGLLNAIKKLGFDEVIDLSNYDGYLYELKSDFLKSEQEETCIISSFCPVINKLIENKYPMLFSNMIPFDYAAMIAARKIRKEKEIGDKKLGIFLLCECIAKLDFAKHPYGNEETAIDHALSLADIFPQIRKNLGSTHISHDISCNGLRFVSTQLFLTSEMQRNYMVADGLSKVENILELLEFGQIKKVKYFHLANCMNGCIGGNLLWGNSFDKDVNVEKLVKEAKEIKVELTPEMVKREVKIESQDEHRSMVERLQEFEALNKQLETLPGFDCGACGYPSCRAMAEEIVKGNSKIEDCRVLR